MNLRQLALVALAVLAVGGTAAAQIAQPVPVAQVTPPPPPPPNGSVATPSAVTSGPPAPSFTIPPAPSASPAASAAPAPAGGRRGRRSSGGGASPAPGASPSETPEPPQFQTMDGVWEVQVQPLNGSGKTFYSHLYVTQKADQLTGTWVREPKDTLTFTGTFDGRLFKLALKDVKGTAWTMSGYAENFGDMVGLLSSSDPKDKGMPFTAAHRKKEKAGITP